MKNTHILNLIYTVIPRGTQLFPEGPIPFPWDDAIFR